ncbi:type II toxin-antitoxin system RelE/ParE family toxin [Terasakiella pusilla]|uniref:type II toxin-antitoxin system RelE/ParE family toxin n=1 Tax=Terasakiella pusilla TaxID=64973 RepID=UPI00048E23FD|nr:type II toxin-antitoxin system RelE/ParE family toxin [Terasakiella pusilla]
MHMRKPLAWLASSKKDYMNFPEDVQDEMGFALDTVQCGKTPAIAKPLKGVGAGVYELIDDFNTDTYRAVYTVQFENKVYVLHAFQKKSKSGIKTPQKDVDLIKDRLKALKSHLEEMKKKKD